MPRYVTDSCWLEDPRIADMMNAKSMPFDGARMVYGGFDVMLDL